MRSINKLLELAKNGECNKDWYKKSGEVISSICDKYGWDKQFFIDILALTSPRVSVTRNMYIAKEFMVTKQIPTHIIPSVQKSIQTYLDEGKINGPKTSEFARALKGEQDAIVLDVWMAKALQVPQEIFSSVNHKQRKESVKRIKKVSENLGWTLAETQAAIWYSACKEGGRVNIGQYHA